jgi:hypothetical protein
MPPREVDRAAATSVPSLVKDLVDQFGRPLDFYREMIQNAIDAGSNRIDVSLELRGDQVVIRVEDDGEGMDEDIIDNHLLVLFRSTKEGDLTKIGKFGIGFVSVFALQPDLVRVCTAKNGQSWRLDFSSYRHYDKYRMPQPREGTLVELLKGGYTRARYDELVRDSLQTISYWCKYSEARIYFADRTAGAAPALVTEDFALADGVSLRHQEEGSDIVIGFSPEEKPFCGFYNKGLTLLEDHQALFQGVEFRAKSRYLEHTLTRDNVLHDENYTKLLGIIRKLVVNQLPDRLRLEIQELYAPRGGAPADPGPAAAGWRRRLPYVRWLFDGFFSRWRRSHWPIFPDLSGRLLSLDDLGVAARKSGGELYFDAEPNDITRALQDDGAHVLAAGEWVALAASWLSAKALRASQAFIRPKVLQDADLPAPLRALLASTRTLDARSRARYGGIVAADFAGAGASLADKPCVAQARPGALSKARPEETFSLFRLRRPAPWGLVNAAHPTLQELARLHAREPGLAAFLALKTLHAEDEACLDEASEAGLLEGALSLGAPAERPA